MDLFDSAAERRNPSDPLADRMRPVGLEELVGQEHLVASGRLLHELIQSDRLPSMILWGPPGTGKTSLARLLAQKTEARFVTLSAVLSGVAELRKLLEEARRARGERGLRTLLFVDEIHRWSKAQQDALLPAVEKGVVTLVGATTENPSFELNAALLSRVRVFVLEPISDSAQRTLIARALAEEGRGLGHLRLGIEADATETIVAGAHGDARRALTTLEVAAERARLSGRDRITREDAEEALQHKALLYDKAGDEHYGVVSAFIKSMRGSDPDAAVYYLTRMLEAGEDPRFLLRRMVIFASEDIGNADPTALTLATSALTAFELVGLPEGVLPMTQAAAYLASAPKSNRVFMAYANARRDVNEYGPLPVPDRLRNASSALARARGHGKGYKYPHDFGGFVPEETYLPDRLVGRRYYEPSDSGFEAELRARRAKLQTNPAPAEPEGSDPLRGPRSR